MLKFRSMRVDAGDYSGVKQTVADDERVTPIGRFLRATSLDELPQLWNILVGDMAVIGPRPMVPGQLAAGVHYEQVVPYYGYRHMVKPGLSGWAQANGLRGPTTDLVSAKDRIDHDCAYVQNFSLALDIRIIVQTLAREFLTGSGI
jgi:lipopolysaccharide/colanic/teichoic acid biosynthesis glycosyltransferase